MWRTFKDSFRVYLSRNTAITSGCTLEESHTKSYAQNSHQSYWRQKDSNFLLISENVDCNLGTINKRNSWRNNINHETRRLFEGIGWGAIFTTVYQFGVPLIKSHIHEINKRLKNGCTPKCSVTPHILSWLAYSMPSTSKYGNDKNYILPENDTNLQESVGQLSNSKFNQDDQLRKRPATTFTDLSQNESVSLPSLCQNGEEPYEKIKKCHSLPNLLSSNTSANPITEVLDQTPEDQKSVVWNRIGVTLASKSNLKEAFSCFKLASIGTDADASYNLGICYERGLGTEQDIEKAIQCYKNAAAMGQKDALFNLGVLECSSRSQQELFESGINRLTEAAQCGNKAAQSYVGTHYLHCGEYHGAVWMLKAAATQGDMVAMFNLALCYENGWGVQVDVTEAFKLYTKASDAGSLDATYSLAHIYLHGQEGLPSDKNIAKKLFLEMLNRDKELDTNIVEEIKFQIKQIDENVAATSNDHSSNSTKSDNHLHGSQSFPEIMKNNCNGSIFDHLNLGLLRATMKVKTKPLDMQPKFWVGDEEDLPNKMSESNNLSVIFS